MALFDALANMFSGNPTSTQLSSGESINWNAPQDSFLAPLANFVRPASRALDTFNRVLTNSDPNQAQPLGGDNMFTSLANSVDRMQTPTSSNAMRHLSALAGAAPQLYAAQYGQALGGLADPDRALNTQLKQRQLEALAQPEQKDFDIKQTAQKAMVKHYLGGELDDYDKASLQALSAMEGNKTSYEPDRMGRVMAITQSNPYDNFLKGLSAPQGQGLPQDSIDYTALAGDVPQSQGASQFNDNISFGDENDPMMVANRQAAAKRATDLGYGALATTPNVNIGSALPVVSGVDTASPLYESTVTEEAAKSAVSATEPQTDLAKLQADELAGRVPSGSVETKENEAEAKLKETVASTISKELDNAEKKRKEDYKKAAKAKITSQISEMLGLYGNLKEMGGITSQDQTTKENVMASAGASDIGRAVNKFIGTQAETIRSQLGEFAKANLIPAIRLATETGVTSINTERELQFYANAAGDVTRSYEANIAALQLLNDNIGLGSEKFADPKYVEQLKKEAQKSIKQAESLKGKKAAKDLSDDELKRMLLND